MGRLTLKAIAAGRTRHSEIAQAVGAEPARVLDRLLELRLVERLVPAGENPSRTRRRTYRIADNFLSFWLGVLDPHRSAIERGLGRSILPVLLRELDDHMGERWEAAFRAHLNRMAGEGLLGEDIVEIGRWWRDAPQMELDAVALAGRRREAVLAGEAKWTRRVDARRELRPGEEDGGPSQAGRRAALRDLRPRDGRACGGGTGDYGSGRLRVVRRDSLPGGEPPFQGPSPWVRATGREGYDDGRARQAAHDRGRVPSAAIRRGAALAGAH